MTSEFIPIQHGEGGGVSRLRASDIVCARELESRPGVYRISRKGRSYVQTQDREAFERCIAALMSRGGVRFERGAFDPACVIATEARTDFYLVTIGRDQFGCGAYAAMQAQAGRAS